MGDVAIGCLAARPAIYSLFLRYVKQIISLYFRLYAQAGSLSEIPALRPAAFSIHAGYTQKIRKHRGSTFE
jgi:hypothetical protein